MADIKSDPVIDYADGRPHWVLDGEEVYGAVPVSLIRDAVLLAQAGRKLSEIEDDPDHPDYPPSWEQLDDGRAELVYALAELFGLEDES